MNILINTDFSTHICAYLAEQKDIVQIKGLYEDFVQSLLEFYHSGREKNEIFLTLNYTRIEFIHQHKSAEELNIEKKRKFRSTSIKRS